MLYWLTRMLMTFALRLFYRRVYSTGVESVPLKGPVILLANHHASLMDAAILGILLKRPIHYFTRGDIFNNKLLARLFTAFNMIPIFDHNGKNSIDANEKSFKKARRILHEGGMILFFPEGSSHTERQLKPLKKGAFRLAFQASEESNHQLNLHIIPVGINYSHPGLAESDVLVHFTTPLLLDEYVQQWTINPAATISQLVKQAHAGLLKNVLHIQSADRLMLTDTCLQINRSEFHFYTDHWMQATRKRFEEEKAICSVINALTEGEAARLGILANRYRTTLSAHRLQDELIFDAAASNTKRMRWLLIAGFPLFLWSYLFNALPVLVAKRIAITQVTRRDFYSWVLLISAALLYCIWILLLFTGFTIVGIRFAIVIILLALFTGPFSLFYINKWKAYRQLSIYKRLQKTNPGVLKELKHLRSEIKNGISNANA